MAVGQRFPASRETETEETNSRGQSGRDGDPGLWGSALCLASPGPCSDVGLPVKPAASQQRWRSRDSLRGGFSCVSLGKHIPART